MDLNPESLLRAERNIVDVIADRAFEMERSADVAEQLYIDMQAGHPEHSKSERFFPYGGSEIARIARKNDYLADLGLVTSEHTAEAGREAAQYIASMSPDQIVGTEHVQVVLSQANKLKGHMPQPTERDTMMFEARARAKRAQEAGIEVPSEFKADNDQFALA